MKSSWVERSKDTDGIKRDANGKIDRQIEREMGGGTVRGKAKKVRRRKKSTQSAKLMLDNEGKRPHNDCC